MPGRVKIINGKEYIFPIEEAASRLSGLGMKVGRFPEALSVPYEIEFPFAVGAANEEFDVEVRGGYKEILALQKLVN